MITSCDAVWALYELRDMYTDDELKSLAFAAYRINPHYGEYDALASLFWQAYKLRYFDKF